MQEPSGDPKQRYQETSNRLQRSNDKLFRNDMIVSQRQIADTVRLNLSPNGKSMPNFRHTMTLLSFAETARWGSQGCKGKKRCEH